MREILIVAGAVITTIGMCLIWIPLGVITAGVLLAAVAFLSE